MRRPRIAVVGTGWWAAAHHIPSLAGYDGADLVALCDPERARADELAARHAVPAVYADLDQLLHAGGVDAVVIATPHSTHHRLARAALDAGLHVLVEKTMTTTAADAFDLVVAAEKAGLHLSVGYTYQHAATAELARAAVQQEIGDLVQVVAEFASGTESLFAAAGSGDEGDAVDAPHPVTYSARLGGGQAHTQLTHVLGMVCWATGREIADVMAFVDHRGLEVDVDDVAAFRFTGGGTGVVASTGVAGEVGGIRHHVRYLGTRGTVEQDMLSARVVVRRADGTHTVHEPGDDGRSTYRAGQPARAFADLVAGRGPNHSPGRPAAAAVACIEAVLESARSGRVASVEQLPPQT